jgi:hypothetical protein
MVHAAAEKAELTGQVRSFLAWIGDGRKLTQTGRIGLADARHLVQSLGTGETSLRERGRPEPSGKASADPGRVVEIAIAYGLPQGSQNGEHVVVRSLHVHRHSVAPERDIAGTAPLAQDVRALGEVRMRLKAHAARVVHRTEHQVLRQFKWSRHRRVVRGTEDVAYEFR